MRDRRPTLAAMKTVLRAFAFTPLLLLHGCLEVDGQQITIRYDQAADRIDVHVVHRGLFAEGAGGGERDPLAKAVKDLADVRAGGEVVFWSNWPLTLDLTRDHPAPVQALLAHVDVENGTLFTDAQGVLCGHQFVRVRAARAFVQKANTLLELAVQQQLLVGTRGHGGIHAWDADTKDSVREFLRGGGKVLAIEPGRVELRLPLSAKDHAWFKHQVEQVLLANLPREIVRREGVAARREGGGDPLDTEVAEAAVALRGERLRNAVERAPSCRFFWDNEVSFVREPELTRVALGVGGEPELRLVKASDGLYHRALLDKLRADGEAIEEGLPDAELERRFAAFRERDAVLPPKVAELRKAGAAEHARTDGK
jgi:hypothetical protein